MQNPLAGCICSPGHRSGIAFPPPRGRSFRFAIRLPRHILPYPPTSLLLCWEARIDPAISRSVHAFARTLVQHPAVVECVPAYASLLVTYAAPRISAYALREYIYGLRPPAEGATAGYHHELPVCYEAAVAPDLTAVAATLGLTPEEIRDLHAGREYLVYQAGYQPGFGFLGVTDERLEIGRRASPRTAVPAGSVGLAGRQTGIYPSGSPGGWQLIGRCPWPLLRRGRDFSRLRAGDRVTFHAVSLREYRQLTQKTAPWPQR